MDLPHPAPSAFEATDPPRRAPPSARAAASALARIGPAFAPLVLLRWLPLPLLAVAALAGGWMVAAALAATLLAVFVQEAPDAPVDDLGRGPQLAVALTLGSAALLPLVLYALAGGTASGPWAWLGLALAAALWFGQIGAAAGHALLHMPGREGDLGAAYFCLFWAGPYVSAHRLVHHPAAATADDPLTADADEGFWGFLVRAWPGALVAGWEMEAALARTRPGGGAPTLHPCLVFLAVSLAVTLVLSFVAGPLGVLLLLLLSGLVQLQLLLTDYVRHHGRQRRRTGQGTAEPYGPAQEWAAPDPFAGLRPGPRTGDHAAHDGLAHGPLPGPAATAAPQLAHAFPVMAALALVPPLYARAQARGARGRVRVRRPGRRQTAG